MGRYFSISYAVTTVLLFITDGDQTYRAVAIGALTLGVPGTRRWAVS